MGQELNDKIPCSTSLKDRKVPHTANRAQRWLKGKNGSTRKRKETRVLWTNRANSLETQIEHLVPAFLGRDLSYVYMFLGTYRAFATTQEVLDLLFARYGCILSSCDEVGRAQEERNMAIYSIFSTWLEQYPEDFFQPPEFPSLNMLLAYMGLNMPGSYLEHRAQLLLSQLQHLEPTEPEAGAPATEQDPEPPQELAPAPTVALAASLEPELPEPIPGAGAHQSGRAVTPPALLGPGQVVVRALIHSAELEEPAAPLPDPEVEQGPAPATGVPEGPEPPPASVEQPASAPEP